MISKSMALATLVAFALLMLLITFVSRDKSKTTSGFLLANRKLGWKRGGVSIAVSWIWAPAIFVASLQSYLNGLAGAFWFIAPNILTFFVFIPIIKRLRREAPLGHTFSEFIASKFPDKHTHLSFLTVHLMTQVFAVVANATAGGFLINLLTGLSFELAVVAMSLTALVYSLGNGFKASVLTDIVQMALILLVAVVLVPWLLLETVSLVNIWDGIGGINGDKSSIFNLDVISSFGLGATFTLICFPISDQMFIQRAMAVRPADLNKTFIFGGLLFGVVPIVLSIPGFIAAAANFQVADPQMVAPMLMAEYLPSWTLALFTIMALAGLCSTIDSALCAMSSIGAIDIFQKYFKRKASDQDLLKASRYFMLLMAVVGTGLSLMKLNIVWIFMISGTVVSCAFIPAIFALFSTKVRALPLSLSIIISLVVSLPVAFYGNIYQVAILSNYSALIGAGLSLLVLLFGLVLIKPSS